MPRSFLTEPRRVFVVQSPLLRRQRRPGRDAALWLPFGARDELGEALERVFTIRFLRSKALRENDDLSALRQSAANDTFEAHAHGGLQLRRVEIESQLHRGRDLVDVLAAGTGAADERQRDRGRGHCGCVGQLDVGHQGVSIDAAIVSISCVRAARSIDGSVRSERNIFSSVRRRAGSIVSARCAPTSASITSASRRA